jgi:hypothetical protein
MTTETQNAWQCPKDGTAMEPRGRRSRVWRCPECQGIFLDAEAFRRGRASRPPMWSPIVRSVVMSVLATVIIRRLRRRRKIQPSSTAAGAPEAATRSGRS